MRRIIDKDVAEKALSLIVRSDIVLRKSSLDKLLEALNLSFDLGISIYDAVYIELTRELEALMHTVDDWVSVLRITYMVPRSEISQ